MIGGGVGFEVLVGVVLVGVVLGLISPFICPIICDIRVSLFPVVLSPLVLHMATSSGLVALYSFSESISVGGGVGGGGGGREELGVEGFVCHSDNNSVESILYFVDIF